MQPPSIRFGKLIYDPSEVSSRLSPDRAALLATSVLKATSEKETSGIGADKASLRARPQGRRYFTFDPAKGIVAQREIPSAVSSLEKLGYDVAILPGTQSTPDGNAERISIGLISQARPETSAVEYVPVQAITEDTVRDVLLRLIDQTMKSLSDKMEQVKRNLQA